MLIFFGEFGRRCFDIFTVSVFTDLSLYVIAVQTYIGEEEKQGIKRDRIIVGGFSQGGAVALYSAFTHPGSSLAGIVALSTWLPLYKTFPGVSCIIL